MILPLCKAQANTDWSLVGDASSAPDSNDPEVWTQSLTLTNVN